MPDIVKSEAFVTLVTNDSYGFGALVLSQSLRDVCTTRQLVVMFTPAVSQEMRDQLLYAFDLMVQVDVLDSQDTVNLQLLTRPDLGVTFTKLHCWRLTQFEKCVFLDADTMVIQNVDELFEREELSAAPDVGWPDCFNSGVFVYRPSEETYASLLQHAFTHGSFDGGDQGLLNSYFSRWSTEDIRKHLPFTFNVVAHAFYSYLPAMKAFGQNIKIVHFIGPNKPWTLGYNRATGEVEGHSSHVTEFVYRWWHIFMEKIHYRLPESLSSIVNVFERHRPQIFESHEAKNSVPTPTEPVTADHQTTKNPVSEDHQMTTPYVPPHVPIFYDPPQPAASDVPEVVVTQEYRPFFHFESFYSEPPMAQGEGHPYAGEMYHASEFSSALTEFAAPSGQPSDPEDTKSNLEHVEDVEQLPELTSSITEEASDKTEAVQESPSNPVEVIAAEIECLSASAVQLSDDVESEEVAEVTPETEEVQRMTVFETSNLKTFTKDQLSDQDRQFNWERGQIDYLGIDSFDNILKQLEGTIKEPLFISMPSLSSSSDADATAVNKEHVQSDTSEVLSAAAESEKNDIPPEE